MRSGLVHGLAVGVDLLLVDRALGLVGLQLGLVRLELGLGCVHRALVDGGVDGHRVLLVGQRRLGRGHGRGGLLGRDRVHRRLGRAQRVLGLEQALLSRVQIGLGRGQAGLLGGVVHTSEDLAGHHARARGDVDLGHPAPGGEVDSQRRGCGHVGQCGSAAGDRTVKVAHDAVIAAAICGTARCVGGIGCAGGWNSVGVPLVTERRRTTADLYREARGEARPLRR